MARLTETEVQDRLKQMREWSVAGNEIYRKFTFKAFMPAITFVDKIAEAAEQANHHPDITINYNQVGIRLSTHSEGGITGKDFQLAEAVDKIYAAGG